MGRNAQAKSMARPDGKSVYVTLPADRKNSVLCFCGGRHFFVLSNKKQILSPPYSDFIPFFKETNIGFYSFSVDKYKKTEYNIGNKI